MFLPAWVLVAQLSTAPLFVGPTTAPPPPGETVGTPARAPAAPGATAAAATDAPTFAAAASAAVASDVPPPAATTSDAPTADSTPRLLTPRPWEAPSAGQFPRFGFLGLLKILGGTMARPVQPQPGDEWTWGVMLAGTALAFATDVQTHRAVQVIPDPELFPGYSLASTVSLLGEGWVDFAVFVALGLIGGRDGRRAAIAGLTALAATAIVARLGKLTFRRERPSIDGQDHWFSDRVIQADAFPSGHAMVAFATAAVLASEYPTLKFVWYGLATWVAFTRVQVSTHWFSDVIVGGALGLLMGWEAYRLTRALEVELQPWLARDGAGIAVSRSF